MVQQLLVMYPFEFFPQIYADQNADFAEIISVYLRIYLCYLREMSLIIQNNTVPNYQRMATFAGSVRFYFIPPEAGQSFAKFAKPSCILSDSWRLCEKHLFIINLFT